MSRLYSAFDEPSLGADLALSDADHTLQTSTTCDAHRMARSTVAITAASSVEFICWSPGGSPPPLTPSGGVPPMLVGICTATAAANKYVGEDTHGVGFCPGDGKLYSNNAVVATLGTAPGLGKKIRLVVVDDTLTVLIDRVPLGDPYSPPSGQSWYYAATVSGDAGQLAVQANPGDTFMKPPSDYGWWAPGDTIESLLAGTEPYITAPTDDVPHEKYAGVIDRTKNPIAISVGVRFWMFGASAPAELGSGGLVQIQFNDPDGRYSRLRDDAAKGLRVPLIRGMNDAAISTFESVYVGVLDHAENDTPQTLQVFLRDQMSRLAVPLKRELFPPTADPALAGKPRPALIGIGRTFTAPVEDAAARQYPISDAPVTAYGRVRVAGKQQVYGTDFNETADGESATFAATTNGRITWEATSFGGSFDPVAPDYITAQGDFTSCGYDATYFVPDGWTNPHATDTDMTVTERFFVHTGTGGQFLKCISQPGLVTGQKLTTPLLHARRTYAYKLHVRAIPFFTDHTWTGTTQPPARLYLSPIETWDQFSGVPLYYERISLTRTGDYAGVFTSPYDIDRPLCLVLECNDIRYTVSDAMAFNYFGLETFVINELPAVTDNVVLDSYGLDGMLRALMIDRGPIASSEYATGTISAQAIDADTGFKYGILVRSSERPTIDSLAQLVLDSTTAAMWNDADGQFDVMRLFSPEDVADADLDGELTVTDFGSPLVEVQDLAEGLTTSAVGCRNYDPLSDSEYGSTSLSDTPLAERAVLASEYQWTVTSRVRLAARYSRAYGRDPIKTCLDRKEHGQAFIDHACGLYTVDRNFQVGKVFEPLGRPLKIRGAYNVTNRGFVDGVLTTLWTKKLVLLGFSPKRPSEIDANCIFWGA